MESYKLNLKNVTKEKYEIIVTSQKMCNTLSKLAFKQPKN